MEKEKETLLLIETSKGDIKIKLYNETPLHRDNFIKLAKEGFYSDLLFHRVIKNFMIQAGDPDSKKASADKMLGAGDVGYTIPAEFVYPQHFHKKGALSAARQGDAANPKKASSGCQFYIVTGDTYSEAEILGMEHKINAGKKNKIFNQLAALQMDSIYEMQRTGNKEGLYALQEELTKEVAEKATTQPDFKFTPEQVKAYTTVGGTPHLDNEYTVFGEVVEGLDIVDAIQKVKTGKGDRPVEEVKIKTVTVID